MKIRHSFYFFFITFLLPTLGMAQGIVTTVAGTGGAGFTGLGGPATTAQIAGPCSIVFDSIGNYYFIRSGRCIVYKVDTHGIISIFAGSDTSGGYSGDGGPATAATLSTGYMICVDKHNNIYICDEGNEVIRKVDPSGIITTYAGNGVAAHTGDGGQATAASLNNPTAVAVDNHDVMYIFENDYIRKISATGIISTIAGDGVTGSYGDGVPATAAQFGAVILGLTTDSAGNVYISDCFNSVIRKIDVGTGIITTVAGNGTMGFAGDGGPATAAKIEPQGMYIDKKGVLYFADAGNRFRKVDRGGLIRTVAGNGISGFAGDGGDPLLAEFDNAGYLAFDWSGNMYITDGANGRIRKITYATKIYDVSDSGHFCKVYPNPGRDFYVRFPESATGTATVSLYNMSGAKVIEGTYPSDADAHLSPDIAAGVYTLSVTIGTKVFHGRVVKQD